MSRGPIRPPSRRRELRQTVAMLLLDGVGVTAVGRAVGLTPLTVAKWRAELIKEGLLLPGEHARCGDRPTVAQRRERRLARWRAMYRDFVVQDYDGSTRVEVPSDEEIEWLEVGWARFAEEERAMPPRSRRTDRRSHRI